MQFFSQIALSSMRLQSKFQGTTATHGTDLLGIVESLTFFQCFCLFACFLFLWVTIIGELLLVKPELCGSEAPTEDYSITPTDH